MTCFSTHVWAVLNKIATCGKGGKKHFCIAQNVCAVANSDAKSTHVRRVFSVSTKEIGKHLHKSVKTLAKTLHVNEFLWYNTTTNMGFAQKSLAQRQGRKYDKTKQQACAVCACAVPCDGACKLPKHPHSHLRHRLDKRPNAPLASLLILPRHCRQSRTRLGRRAQNKRF